ncbi:MAG: hypothetical protein QXY70_02680 [Nanopusillaceae archaeon]
MLKINTFKDTQEFIKLLKERLEKIKEEEDIDKLKGKLQEEINNLNSLISVLDLLMFLNIED